MVMRLMYVLSLLFLTFTGSAASAEQATITSGRVGLYWDGGLSGLQLNGPGTQLIGEVMKPPPDRFRAGTLADLNDTISTTNQSHHPFTEQVNGTTYSSVWIKATLTFTTQPM